ncbi:UDP-4-amino-4,6-dideoxy-N-acetyl-beta-L-altrosamine N-acetyltransferase [Halobacillus sp. GSS1]|uniref:UDP-4-amino-4, 6-dideoxy-N-acetyl-beta-L-altrosamine N-acetyltransferase n=1 Tax=Halobacillus sp. GSS1 TaxID=2815919 RepID=UPI001A8FEB40|nr:UDP-4-amino-4,6-dideoxy-N-acetyl-beta-L-altrosamine N-acetyltransferase [Halobacillus sp. GSS1]MBN9654817.1 UDP-4-amino-4,6-dideoxy-N-acetyl-beta-L-altrosamine N-acetyltransferase [Halobacillus sp. GSS1]
MNEYHLRSVESTDLPIIWKWRNAEHIRKHMYNDKVIPWEEHTAWFEKEQQNTSSSFYIFIYQERPLGVVRFTNIDLENGTCDWGFYIGDQRAPKGAGTVMGMLALDLIFKNDSIRKVCAEVLDFNIASLRYHQKLGFLQEGKLVEQLKREDQLIDVIPMGLFKDVWNKRRKTLMRGQEGGN